MSRGERKVTVVGAGPAGIGAAQQCVREGIDDVLVLEKESVGGLILQANRIENLPGFVGEDGRKMVKELEKIVLEYDIEVEYSKVVKIERTEKGFRLKTEKGSKETKYLVLATGTTPRSWNFEGEKHHPGWRDYSGEKVVIVGGGDAAYDYSLRVNRLGGEVTILRRSEPKALPVLVEEAREKGIKEVEAEVTGVEKCENGFSIGFEDKAIEADELITAIGRDPNLPDFSFELEIEDVTFPTGETDHDNLFVIGSTVLGTYRQTSLCWGMGIAAGMKLGRTIPLCEKSKSVN
ncbi:MAG: NAD(P)/FAD-dependent oxidoreductase [Candidatus Thermoplasmatota archaeon]